MIDDVEVSQARTHRDQIAALDDFRSQPEEISADCIVPHGRLTVFVDDLDRCLPDRAVEVLESAKLLLNVPGCVFVMGVDREVIEEGCSCIVHKLGTAVETACYGQKSRPTPASKAAEGRLRKV